MVHAGTENSDEIDELQARWPTWKIWRSAGGSWLATRRETVGVELISIHWANTLMESNSERLVAKLDHQRQLEDEHAMETTGLPAEQGTPPRLSGQGATT